ncbi:MAG: glycogen debranching protein GlgX [Janthinobacterium lividum]
MLENATYKVSQGVPQPMGATWDGARTNFSLFSENATKVELCLFDETGEHEVSRLALPEFTDGIWHGCVEGILPGTVYGYRVSGPYLPQEGHRFNPHKLLLDPYATAHIGALVWGPEIFGYIMETGDDTTFDTRDSAPFVPKCIVTDPSFEWHDTRTKPTYRVPWDDTILYELHVKGYTELHPDLSEDQRGTYAGLGQPKVVEYIRSLGVTSVELLPIHMFLDEPHLRGLKLTNFWGYNSIGFFAPEPRYAADPKHALQEFKAMVAQYHDACMEVILDVVYNHTAEGNEHGPTLSFKGIDNASYYRLQGNRRYYINDTGTGNTVNVSHPRVLQMICDSLRYWVEQGHVDGFRFDLATILAREPAGFDQGAGFLKVVGQDPVLNRVKLIAEPWDIGPGGYRVGEFPPGWMEWNDTFRDRVRGFWIGKGNSADFAQALAGSPKIFDRQGRRPWTSINFVTAHDGFTLYDLVSYGAKQNQANGEDNRDGSNNNLSSNGGADGPTQDVTILKRREQRMRNLLASLLLAQGTPMLLAGDEFARTQGGNNNAYCQDNAISWVDWSLRGQADAMVQFTRQLAMLRHEHPLLRSRLFLEDSVGKVSPAADARADGASVPRRTWLGQSPGCFGMLLTDGTSGSTNASDADALVLITNTDGVATSFTLPTEPDGKIWKLKVDTAAPGTPSTAITGGTYTVQPQSMVLLAADSQQPQR